MQIYAFYIPLIYSVRKFFAIFMYFVICNVVIIKKKYLKFFKNLVWDNLRRNSNKKRHINAFFNKLFNPQILINFNTFL